MQICDWKGCNKKANEIIKIEQMKIFFRKPDMYRDLCSDHAGHIRDQLKK